IFVKKSEQAIQSLLRRGRSGETRTHGLLVPKPSESLIFSRLWRFVRLFTWSKYRLLASFLHCFRVFHFGLWDEMWSYKKELHQTASSMVTVYLTTDMKARRKNYYALIKETPEILMMQTIMSASFYLNTTQLRHQLGAAGETEEHQTRRRDAAVLQITLY
ncbi:MAG: hypothetical protein DBY29_07480, partial [Coprobacillus sp.]